MRVFEKRYGGEEKGPDKLLKPAVSGNAAHDGTLLWSPQVAPMRVGEDGRAFVASVAAKRKRAYGFYAVSP